MNKLEQLSKEKFGGDLHQTFNYLFSECSEEMQEEYVEDITAEQAVEFSIYLGNYAEEQGIDVQKMVNDEFALSSMSLTKEDVIKMEKNPYKAKMGKDLLKFVVLNAGVASIYLAASAISPGAVELVSKPVLGVASIMNSFFAIDTVKDMLNYFRFKKLKKKYSEELNEENTRGMR